MRIARTSRRALAIFGLLAVPALVSGSACGGSNAASGDGGTETGSSSGAGSSSGSDSCSDPPNRCVEPPSRPSAPSSGPVRAHDYAIHNFFLGDTERTGGSPADAWKTFGYDLDDKLTTASSTDVCTLVAGATTQVQVDGAGGIDNSWGENLLPIALMNSSTVPPVFPQPESTEMIYVIGFDDARGNLTDAVGLTGVLLGGVTLPSDTLTWNLGAVWPVAPGTVSGCTAAGGCPAGTNAVTSALVKLPAAFQNKGTFASGTPVDIMLPLNIAGQTVPIDIRSAFVTFSPLRPGAVTNGTIAGVLNTQELIATLHRIAGDISTSLCTESAFESIATQVEQTSDIVYDGKTIANPPGQPCNAISIGLGFDAIEIAPPSVIAPGTPSPPDRCAD